ncbi:universal stress protein [Natrialbaceae archaeon A-CW3]
MTNADPEVFAAQARDQYATVLVPTDGSDQSQQAVERAVEVAAALDATVHALSAIEDPGTLKRDQLRADAERDAKEAVDRVTAEADRAGLEATSTVEPGVPHEKILEYVTDEDVDLIVMGTHGRTGLDHVLIGSVAERVVRTSPVPVLTVRPAE